MPTRRAHSTCTSALAALLLASAGAALARDSEEQNRAATTTTLAKTATGINATTTTLANTATEAAPTTTTADNCTCAGLTAELIPNMGVQRAGANGTAAAGFCAGTPCGERCSPSAPLECAENYSPNGDRPTCTAGNWVVGGYKCVKKAGVHRVGVGVYILNIADINMKAGSFYIDYLLTMLTEKETYATYNDALESFHPDNTHGLNFNPGDDDDAIPDVDKLIHYSQRECSPEVRFVDAKDGEETLAQRLGSKSPLGKTKDGTSNTGFRWETPVQFHTRQAARAQNSSDPADTKIEKTYNSEAKLGLTFVNADTYRMITSIQFNADKSTVRYRVQGKMFFKPDLRSWPFDKQQLELSIEALDLVSDTNPEYIFCHMSTFSGLSPQIRLADRATQLNFFPRIIEVCWPPYADPHNTEGECTGNLACSINEANSCDACFDRKASDSGINFQNSRYNQAFSCKCRGGKTSSSRYTAVIEYTAPKAQRFLKHYLPVVFISMINSVVHLVHYKETNQRLSICIGTLTALVLFHVSLGSQLPPSTRVTAADYVLMCCYALNFITWGAVLSIMQQQQKEGDTPIDFVWVHKVWDTFRWYGIILCMAVFVHAFVYERDVWIDWQAHKTGVMVFWLVWVPIGIPIISTIAARLYRELRQCLKPRAKAVVLEVEALGTAVAGTVAREAGGLLGVAPRTGTGGASQTSGDKSHGTEMHEFNLYEDNDTSGAVHSSVLVHEPHRTPGTANRAWPSSSPQPNQQRGEPDSDGDALLNSTPASPRRSSSSRV